MRLKHTARMEGQGMSGHGWVIPNPGGVVARCGGPALCCVCQEEQRLGRALTIAEEREAIRKAQGSDLRPGEKRQKAHAEAVPIEEYEKRGGLA